MIEKGLISEMPGLPSQGTSLGMGKTQHPMKGVPAATSKFPSVLPYPAQTSSNFQSTLTQPVMHGSNISSGLLPSQTNLSAAFVPSNSSLAAPGNISFQGIGGMTLAPRRVNDGSSKNSPSGLGSAPSNNNPNAPNLNRGGNNNLRNSQGFPKK